MKKTRRALHNSRGCEVGLKWRNNPSPPIDVQYLRLFLSRFVGSEMATLVRSILLFYSVWSLSYHLDSVSQGCS